MGNGHPLTFTHTGRQRWAQIPTALFLVTVFLILWLQPRLIWSGGVDAATRSSALLLSGILALFVAFNVVRRWAQPFEVRLERDRLLAKPLIGPSRQVAYPDIVGLTERPRSFFRFAPELEVQVRGGPHIVVSGAIRGYDQLQRTLRHRARLPNAPAS